MALHGSGDRDQMMRSDPMEMEMICITCGSEWRKPCDGCTSEIIAAMEIKQAKGEGLHEQKRDHGAEVSCTSSS